MRAELESLADEAHVKYAEACQDESTYRLEKLYEGLYNHLHWALDQLSAIEKFQEKSRE